MVITYIRNADPFAFEVVIVIKFYLKCDVLIVQLGGGEASVISFEQRDRRMRMIPWGGVAAPLNDYARRDFIGQVYCFLPLPGWFY